MKPMPGVRIEDMGYKQGCNGFVLSLQCLFFLELIKQNQCHIRLLAQKSTYQNVVNLGCVIQVVADHTQKTTHN